MVVPLEDFIVACNDSDFERLAEARRKHQELQHAAVQQASAASIVAPEQPVQQQAQQPLAQTQQSTVAAQHQLGPNDVLMHTGADGQQASVQHGQDAAAAVAGVTHVLEQSQQTGTSVATALAAAGLVPTSQQDSLEWEPPRLDPMTLKLLGVSRDRELPPPSVYDIDVTALSQRPWAAPGADPTDYFNYGFDEHTWRQYCLRQSQIRLHFLTQREQPTDDARRAKRLPYREQVPPQHHHHASGQALPPHRHHPRGEGRPGSAGAPHAAAGDYYQRRR